MFSRNASSSRAVPFKKLVEEATTFELMAMPEVWGSEQKGMQTGASLEIRAQILAKGIWSDAAFHAARSADSLSKIGVHKSIVNRLLEPFTHINVVVTATEWDNFFGLRLDKGAEPTMRALAVAMWEARNASTPRVLKPGEWHLPFITDEDQDSILKVVETDWNVHPSDEEWCKACIKVSVARCARVSYMSFDTGKRSTIDEDLRLYDKLLGAQPLHASPAEHQATPSEDRSLWGNFLGFAQYRKMLKGESCAPLPETYRESNTGL